MGDNWATNSVSSLVQLSIPYNIQNDRQNTNIHILCAREDKGTLVIFKRKVPGQNFFISRY